MNNKSFNLNQISDFGGLRISLASPEEIHSWSFGEVLKPETINYRTLKPEKDGLFCEKIFGPSKDWECYCGKYKRIRYRGIVCDKCGVEVTQSKVRRERMGHISLASPVAHIWYFKGAPSVLSLLLDISPRNFENVIYFASYLVVAIDKEKKKKTLEKIDQKFAENLCELEKKFAQEKKNLQKKAEKEKNNTNKKIADKEKKGIILNEIDLKAKKRIQILKEEIALEKIQIEQINHTVKNLIKNIKPLKVLSEAEYLKIIEYKANDFFEVQMGAEAILKVIENINLDKLSAKLREEIRNTTGQRHIKAAKRLRIIEGFKQARTIPEWMILRILPVIPPDLRPVVQLSGGRFATSDLNDLYRRVINRNNRLKHLLDLGAPEIILRNEKRMLQESVDSLIDSARLESRHNARKRKISLRSLSDMLRGKQGRFRQNLLGKRVDYSGRSVIIVGPELKLNQCGLPKDIALEMFKPFLLREIILRGLAPNVKSAKHVLERRPPEVYDILEEITKNHPVLLNRAPTLHRLGIQSFLPILIEGNAIAVHPCVCAGYNADFDGDQMAIHIPLTKKAKEECLSLMSPSQNLLKPANGIPITVPNKEMALGLFYLTSENKSLREEKIKIFADEKEAILAYQSGKIPLRQIVKAKINGKIIETTTGRIIFNEILPENLRFFNQPVRAATIMTLINRSLNILPNEEIVKLIDKLKELGFWAATLSGGSSVSLFDCEIIPEKEKMVEKAEEKIGEIEKTYLQGLLTEEEKRRLSNEIWLETTEEIANLTWSQIKPENPVKIIIESGGARASKDQLKQLCAMRGLVVDPLGKIVPLPTKSNFRQGLSIFEYVTSTRGSRKGLTDSALKTADAGYLTRRLVDVSHDCLIREEDCHPHEGIEIRRDNKRKTPFSQKILGRFLFKNIISPKSKKVILKKNQEILEENLELIEKEKIESVFIRSPLTCKTKYGICQLCYGRDFGSRKLVEIGMPVGILAAQSIGEPGTQLTMRVKHTGGIIGLDVTQGLPRVEELFETRTPKILAPLAEISGRVSISETSEGYKIKIKSKKRKLPEEKEYLVPLTSNLLVSEKEEVLAGTQLASGYLDIKKVLETKGMYGAQRYLINEIQAVYESQGIIINDKHFEVIIRKMSDKVIIETSGDTTLLPGEIIDKIIFEEENAKILVEGGEPATAKVIILGITRASLHTYSWLSAASFQETTNILTTTAIRNQEDKLIGLKENVIIGRLIPVSPQRARIE